MWVIHILIIISTVKSKQYKPTRWLPVDGIRVKLECWDGTFSVGMGRHLKPRGHFRNRRKKELSGNDHMHSILSTQ